mmetsp:Transcript_78032/g.252580  ORF Transcript_78032/g.252580 Transcript_78032/m.252580 type:complete len:271 (+) Transcript_78032:981-1793(+)
MAGCVSDGHLAARHRPANHMLFLHEAIRDLLLGALELHPLVVDRDLELVGQPGSNVLVLHVCGGRLLDQNEGCILGALHLNLRFDIRELELHRPLQQGLGLLGQLPAQLARHMEPHSHQAVGCRVEGSAAEVLWHLNAQVLGVRCTEIRHLLPQPLRYLCQVLAKQLALPLVLVDLPLGVVDEQGPALLGALALILVKVLVGVQAAILQAIGAETALATRTGNGTAIVVVKEGLLAPRTLEGENVVDDLQPMLVQLHLLSVASGLRQLLF